MAAFRFNLPELNVIRASENGATMLAVANGLIDADHILVTGPPGSGKTTVSILRLLHLIGKGEQVQFLTYQRLLTASIIQLLRQQGVGNGYNYVNTIHSWFPKKTRGQLLGFSNDPNKLTESEIKVKLQEYGLNRGELILDESQDLEPRVINALAGVYPRILTGGDNDQQLRPEEGSNVFGIETALEASGREVEHIKLQFNYRNKDKVYNFARQFVPNSEVANNKDLVSRLQPSERDVEVFSFDSQDQLRNSLQEKLKSPENQGLNIAILFPYTDHVTEYSAFLRESGISHSMYLSKNQGDENNLQQIVVTTFISAKGLEFDMVILPNFEAVRNNEKYRKQAYVACTRAKESLSLYYVGKELPRALAGFDSSSYFDGSDLF